MADTTFVNGTVIVPAWLNDVNRVVYKDTLNVKNYGAKGDGTTDDTAAIQAAVSAAVDYTVIEFPPGNYKITAPITLKPKLTLSGGATVTSSTTAFQYTPGTPVGYPGQISISGLVIVGPGAGTLTAGVKIDANAPFCTINDCSIFGFGVGVYLRDAYCSKINNTTVSGCGHGIQLYRESHATQLQNCFVDNCTITGLSINYGGGVGTGATHNVSVIGGSYQNTPTGIWAEQALELHTYNTYHEGNTVHDFVIGVNDSGGYNRACYSVVIDGFHSSSPCTGGRNVKIEHTVGIEVRAAAWNSGCSTTATLLSYDGFSDRVYVDILRYSTTTVTNTAPVDFTGDPTRGVLSYKGRLIFGNGQTDAIQFGTLATTYGSLYKGFTNGGRDAVTLRSTVQDMQFRTPEIHRFQDGAGNDLLQVDALNNLVIALRPLQLQGQTTGTTVGPAGGASALPATPLGYLTTKINGTTVKIPYYN